MKRVVCVLWMLCGLLTAQGLQLHKPSLNSKQSEYKSIERKNDGESKIQVGKNLSIKADAFMNDGYSEMELETGKANLNELDSTMSRYGTGVGLSYSVKKGSWVELELFASNGLEINTQRRGGKIKVYDTVQRYEENAYNYGNKVMYSAWVNSIGLTIKILRMHRLMLTFKQTQFSLNDAILAMGPTVSMQGGGMGFIGLPLGNMIINDAQKLNPYTITTQFFITYSYTF